MITKQNKLHFYLTWKRAAAADCEIGINKL